MRALKSREYLAGGSLTNRKQWRALWQAILLAEQGKDLQQSPDARIAICQGGAKNDLLVDAGNNALPFPGAVAG
tara:strand:+ start:1512 stop:1733 length:222 start_codon:yes stop_codon:yes gene_type:complete